MGSLPLKWSVTRKRPHECHILRVTNLCRHFGQVHSGFFFTRATHLTSAPILAAKHQSNRFSPCSSVTPVVKAFLARSPPNCDQKKRDAAICVSNSFNRRSRLASHLRLPLHWRPSSRLERAVEEISHHTRPHEDEPERKRTHSEHRLALAAHDRKSQQQYRGNAHCNRSKHAARHTERSRQLRLPDSEPDECNKL